MHVEPLKAVPIVENQHTAREPIEDKPTEDPVESFDEVVSIPAI